MRKRFLSFIIIICIFFLVCPIMSVQARALTKDEMKVKISELKAKYSQGTYDDGNVGNASECMGFAVKVSRFIFGEDCRSGWYVHGNVDELCVGDHVRYRSSYWNHSITVINIVGNTVYYIDCNGSAGTNRVGYASMTKQELHQKINQYVFTPDCEGKRNGLGYIQTQPNNWVKTLGDDPEPDNRSKWRVTATDGINVRSNAGTGYTKVGALAYNAYFYITERKQADGYTWGKTDSGWVVLDYATHVSGPIPEIKNDTVPAIHKDENAHVRNGFFTFKNVASGTFMNVWGGGDSNGTAITTWSYDGSIDQRFNVIHRGNGKYKIYAECSSDGRNRVVDVLRNYADLAEGQKVDLYDPNDDAAQLFYIWPVGNDEYVFEIAAKDGYVIAPPSGAAGSNSKDSQLTLQRYTGAAHQKWRLCNNNGKDTTPNISYTEGSYKVDTDGDPLNMRSGADTSYDLVGSVSDKTTLRITQVSGNWGYTSYNGTNGWICLDFTVYTVTMDSISISTMPDKVSYCTGEQFDPLGMRIKANYSNGSTEELTTGFTTSADFSTAGNKNVTVSYKGKTTSFSVNVVDVAVNELAIQENITKKTYSIGEKLDTSGLCLIATYNNGETGLIDTGFITDYDFSTPGTKTVTVSYGGKSTSYQVEVLQNASDSSNKLQVSSGQFYQSENGVVDIKLASKDIYDGNMTIQYDASKLKINDVKACGALLSRQVTINKNYASDKIRVSFAGTTPVVSDDAVLKIEFTPLEGSGGLAYISITEAKMYDSMGRAVNVDISNGTIEIVAYTSDVNVNNIQSISFRGQKIVTANVSSDEVICCLAAYKNGALLECDRQYPISGSVELSVADTPGAQYKLMVWNAAMQPMMAAKDIY